MRRYPVRAVSACASLSPLVPLRARSCGVLSTALLGNIAMWTLPRGHLDIKRIAASWGYARDQPFGPVSLRDSFWLLAIINSDNVLPPANGGSRFEQRVVTLRQSGKSKLSSDNCPKIANLFGLAFCIGNIYDEYCAATIIP